MCRAVEQTARLVSYLLFGIVRLQDLPAGKIFSVILTFIFANLFIEG